MKILLMMVVVQSLNPVILVWFNRVAVLRVIVLRQQLTVYKRKSKKPMLRNRTRIFWSLLSKIWRDWTSELILMRPETVMRWRERKFRDFWRRKSQGRSGRPSIPNEHIDFIFVIMEPASRKVVHLHVTDHPTLEWTKQQIRNACFEEEPKFLRHDNDGKSGQLGHPFRVERAGKRVSCRSAYDEWLWQEMGILGIAIPFGAPNAAAQIEQLIGTLRQECLDRMLIWNERHLRCALSEFIGWYNRGRVHQGLNGIPDPDLAIDGPKPLGGRLVAIPVLNGLHQDYRLAA